MPNDDFSSAGMKTIIISAPLVTKGGVFRSTCELVESARAQGLDWSALIITRGDLNPGRLPVGVDVRVVNQSGIRGLLELRRILSSSETVGQAEAVISMIPQTDMLLSTINRGRKKIHVAFVRGAAWPRKGESNELRRRIWRLIERWALGQMDEVWTTTTVLREEIEWSSAVIVPAGIADIGSQEEPQVSFEPANVVWAARMSIDKNPHLFLNVLDELKVPGFMYGDGELRFELETSKPTNVTFGGWADPLTLWDSAGIYLGTSFREAFGRSAVEAAARGLPMVLSNAFGAAPLLFTDPELKDRFVLDPLETDAWIRATRELSEDAMLRQRVGHHVWKNANLLTIEKSVEAVRRRLHMIKDLNEIEKNV
ncbi:glycosyltransferase family 4 protein [Arthrobacter sp. MYb227]|uniref:glycosyltransferase family 4 protein n=1 Tax=Arthrobacter sp. MYb227 TaxID=1848601 RepID=UPI0015E41042|nr:glycosyltransferase family 4 protein [Arthrobacter sp. MYb227]